jgi:hypothetical protein
MDEIRIIISPLSSPCYNFRRDDRSRPEKRTVFIAPIRFTEDEEGNTTLVAYACSSGKYCHDRDCIYSCEHPRKKEENEPEE